LLFGRIAVLRLDVFPPEFYERFGFQEEKRVILMGKDL
jgi:hypothetical protein